MAQPTDEELAKGCDYEKCPYKLGLGPIRDDGFELFPCETKYHKSCSAAWRLNNITDCPKHGNDGYICHQEGEEKKSARALAEMEGGRRRTKRSKRNKRSSKRNKRSSKRTRRHLKK